MRTIKAHLSPSWRWRRSWPSYRLAASGAISDFEQKQQNKIKKASNKAGKAINQVADLEDSLASSNSSQDNKNATQDERTRASSRRSPRSLPACRRS